MTLLGVPLAKIIVLIVISNMILGIGVLLSYEIQGWQDWAGSGMSVRESLERGWTAVKTALRSTPRGKF